MLGFLNLAVTACQILDSFTIYLFCFSNLVHGVFQIRYDLNMERSAFRIYAINLLMIWISLRSKLEKPSPNSVYIWPHHEPTMN
ncbi:hypothetical protein Lwor_1773 [Legionella worsleiensis]|uniref:Uncharacterized protein n=1 Tax=Legionella worsleiensis TaxID=45076 RepID=A0A0W1A9Z5_9GAMM|nr:hypothetical protein Lwor_1773 [Legionella worsleiensis]